MTGAARQLALGLLAAWVVVSFCGCGENVPELALAKPDRMVFETQVYPVLMRDCAFYACHGSHERFLQVFGPGRVRMLETTQPLDAVTPGELDHTYERARAMIDPEHPERSLLLRKPLAVAKGGASHEGTDELGRDVYEDDEDPDFLVLRAWVMGAEVEAASDGGTMTTMPAGDTTAP